MADEKKGLAAGLSLWDRNSKLGKYQRLVKELIEPLDEEGARLLHKLIAPLAERDEDEGDE